MNEDRGSQHKIEIALVDPENRGIAGVAIDLFAPPEAQPHELLNTPITLPPIRFAEYGPHEFKIAFDGVELLTVNLLVRAIRPNG